MKDAIYPIFSEWLEKHSEPFKTSRIYNTFDNESDKLLFCDMITDERESAFKDGFRTAIRLLIG